MKKWTWISVVLISLFLTACAEKSDPPVTTGSSETEPITTTAVPVQEEASSERDSSQDSEILVTLEAPGKIYDVDTAAAAAIMSENEDLYLPGECMGEGHIILGTEEGEGQVTVYLLAMFGWYQFQDDNFVKVSGSGAIPTVMTFRLEEDGAYLLEEYKTAQDGSLFVPSIKELFPEELWEACISPSEENQNALRNQEQEYAAAYLEGIGRTAEIGDYSDFEHKLLTDVGVSVEVSNRLLERKDELPARCPDWIGEVEQVENGVRYQYARAYDPEQKEIIFSKVDLTTSKMVEEMVFDSETGDLIRHETP